MVRWSYAHNQRMLVLDLLIQNAGEAGQKPWTDCHSFVSWVAAATTRDSEIPRQHSLVAHSSLITNAFE
jgi:hypothetical protein